MGSGSYSTCYLCPSSLAKSVTLTNLIALAASVGALAILWTIFFNNMFPCAHCNAPCRSRCSLCQSVYYCSREHSIADWPSHKSHCHLKPPKDALSQSDFSRGKVTGILFAEDENEPRLIQLDVFVGYTRTGKTWQTLNLRPYLPDDEKKGRARVHLDGPLVPREGGIKVGLMSDVFYRSNFASDGSRRNRCIELLTKGKMAQPWSGPFIMLRRTHLDTHYSVVMEQDLPMLKTFFTTGQMDNFPI